MSSSIPRRNPPRILICYYSMTGNTRRLAQEIQLATGATLEELHEPKPRHGFTGVLRALFDAITKRQPPLSPLTQDAATFDLLLLGGPIWARRLASPVRTYAARFAASAPRVAFFCSEGGAGAELAFAELESLCGRKSVATLVVDAAHLERAAHAGALRAFVEQLSLPPEQSPASRGPVAAAA